METLTGGTIIGLCFIVGVICLIVGMIISSGIEHRKWVKEELKREKAEKCKPVEISMEQLQKLVEMGLDKEKSFEEQVQDWLINGCNGPNLLETSDPYVEVDSPCVGYNCACSPNREDCCRSEGYDKGICKVYININKLCGIEEYARNPELITPAEAADLARALNAYHNRNAE